MGKVSGRCHCSIRIQDLGVQKGEEEILKKIDLQVNHGEILGLIGKNGTGKTTLLKAIMGRIPYSGTVEFHDRLGKRIQRPRIGYVPQALRFDENEPITVGDLFAANHSNFPIFLGHTKKEEQRTEELLQKVGMGNCQGKKIGNLSGGELQRVLLAFALDPIPDVLLLDEPVSAVDRKGIRVFYEIVTSMRSEYHMPIILVSHDLGHVQRYASRVALIDHKIITEDRADKIMNNRKIRETFLLE